VIEDAVAITVPLKGTHVLLVVVAAGFRSIALLYEVLPFGAHLTVARPLAEFVLKEPEIVYVAPTVHPVMIWYTPAPPEATYEVCIC
jgi:hypothetical protein